MSQVRLNSTALLHCHRDYAEQVDVNSIADEFISRCALRHNTFAAS